jgi:hypothetical protein
MSADNPRKKLHRYVADLDEEKVKAMLTLLEDEAVYETTSTLTEADKEEILRREQNRVSGKSKTYTLSQAKKSIRRKKAD